MDVSNETKVINIIINHGQGHLWNASDVHYARTVYRIVGLMVGSLPRHPHQSAMLGLPLKLMPEEVTLLLEKEFAKPIQYKEISDSPSQQSVDKFNELRENCYKEQIVAASEQRKCEIKSVADMILKGKLKKLQMKSKSDPSVSGDMDFGLTREKVIEMECEKIQKLPEHLQVIQIFTEHPLIESLKPNKAKWLYPRNDSEKLRYLVYKDLWENEYYVTSGVKFGGDFLAYKGDPILFHASFIVKCVIDLNLVDNFDLMTLSRLGNATKKVVVLASCVSNKVHYKSFQLVGDKLT